MVGDKSHQRTAIIACKMLQYEIDKAMQETGCHYPITWVDSEYHNDPNGLRLKLQEEIDKLTDIDRILLTYGSCGNATVGLKASTADLIIPKFEDCIAMVLSKQGQVLERPKATFFLTKGWLEGSRSLAREYEHAVKRYGAERAKRIFGQMFRHYKYLMLIDTKAYSFEECQNEVQELAQTLNLEMNIGEGDVWLFKRLFSAGVDQNFCFIPKGEMVSDQDFGLNTGDLPRQPL